MNADAGAERVGAFASNGLSFARGEHAEEGIETVISSIFPMELLVHSFEVSPRTQQLPFRLDGKRHVHRGRLAAPADLDQCVGEGSAHMFGLRSRPHEKPPPGGWCK